MDEQPRLFRLAVESINIAVNHEWNRGWRVVFGARRGDETWDAADQRTYSYLSTSEMADVIASELERVLGLS